MYVYTHVMPLFLLSYSLSLSLHTLLSVLYAIMYVYVSILYIYVMSDLTHLTKASLCS